MSTCGRACLALEGDEATGSLVLADHVVAENRRRLLVDGPSIQLGQREPARHLALDEGRRLLVLGRRVLLIHGAVVLARILAALEKHLDERLELGQRVARVVDVSKRLGMVSMASQSRVDGPLTQSPLPSNRREMQCAPAAR